MTTQEALGAARALPWLLVAGLLVILAYAYLPSLIYPATPGQAVECIHLPETKIRGEEVRV